MAIGCMSEYKRKELAFHEAGHIVVAAVEGFRPEGLKVFLKIGGEAEITIACARKCAEDYAFSRLRVLMAGAVSQCIHLWPNDPACPREALSRKREGWMDYSKALELAWLVRNVRPGASTDPDTAAAEADQILGQCLNASAIILRRNWEAVNRLANRVILGLDGIAAAGPDDLNAPDHVCFGRAEILDLIGAVS
jgi:hypothetical protein